MGCWTRTNTSSSKCSSAHAGHPSRPGIGGHFDRGSAGLDKQPHRTVQIWGKCLQRDGRSLQLISKYTVRNQQLEISYAANIPMALMLSGISYVAIISMVLMLSGISYAANISMVLMLSGISYAANIPMALTFELVTVT